MTRFAATLIVLALAAASAVAAPSADVKPAGTIIPDTTYGEGGTKQSIENDKHEVISETWRDRYAIIREQVEFDPDGAQYWGFYNGDGMTNSVWRQSMIVIRPMERPAGRWRMWVIGPGEMTVKESSTLSRAELDTDFAYWHIQLRSWANNGVRRLQSGNG